MLCPPRTTCVCQVCWACSSHVGVNLACRVTPSRLARVHRMTVALTPTYVSLSHAGGLPDFLTNVELATQVQRVSSVAALLHLSVTNMGAAEVAKGLDAAKAAGVCNILAVRGDPNNGATRGVLGGGGRRAGVPVPGTHAAVWLGAIAAVLIMTHYTRPRTRHRRRLLEAHVRRPRHECRTAGSADPRAPR